MGVLKSPSLKTIEQWGIPVVIDKTLLTLSQGRALVGMVEKLMDDAEHEKKTAIGLAIKAFQMMFEKTEDGWRAKQKITLGSGHGVIIRGKYYLQERREEKMGKIRIKRNSPYRRLRIAESKKQKKDAISGVVRLALETALKDDKRAKRLHKKLGLRLKTKKEKA